MPGWKLTRRSMFSGSAGIAASLPFLASAVQAQGPGGGGQASPDRLFDPDYKRVPLRSETVRYTIIQSPDIAIDHNNAAQDRREALNYMISLLDRSAGSFSASPDLVSFHEMPLHGFGEWDRQEMLKVAIEIPGPETEAIGQKAKELNCYVSFGAYVRDRDWPDHVIMMGVLIGPDGNVAAQHWKARGTLGGLGLFTSTVYENFDRYVEMYGVDAVVPVARTDIGNICLTGVQNDPLLFTTMAMKGAEIFCRYATGSVPREDAIFNSAANRVFTGYANSSIYPQHRDYVGGVGTGGSMIVDPSGKVLAEADEHEDAIRATLPMATFRANHRVPNPQWDLYAPVFAQFKPRFDRNWFQRYLPKSWADTRRFFADKANW